MSALQGMDINSFIIVAPTFLIVTYILISVQKKLCNGVNEKRGLIIPVIFFIAATILAFRPLFIVDMNGAEGMIAASLMVWMTFNIPTLALLFPYLIAIKNKKEAKYIQEVMAAREAAEAEQLSKDKPEATELSAEENL